MVKISDAGLYHQPFSRYPTLRRWYRNIPLRQALQKQVIDDFSILSKRFSVRFCAFLFLVVAVCAVDVDAPACVDGAGTVFRVGGMAGLGVGPPPAVATPAKRC